MQAIDFEREIRRLDKELAADIAKLEVAYDNMLRKFAGEVPSEFLDHLRECILEYERPKEDANWSSLQRVLAKLAECIVEVKWRFSAMKEG